ncbi:DNA-binding response regulator, partial [Achromobacter xylosoxidans]
SLAAQAPQPGGSAERHRLTARETQIVQWLARGASNKVIARELDVSESTVKIHVQNVLKKLNLTSRVQVAVYAVEHGLYTEE